jgi:hypothetical protein
MKYNLPVHVTLTNDEEKWYKVISLSDNENVEWESTADAMESLFNSLAIRKAIPKIRIAMFDNPKYAETGKRSPKEIFESNGTRGNYIYRHPDFLKYLKYYIDGPDLPDAVIQGFCKIFNDDLGTSGMLLDQIRKYVRSCVRNFHLDRHTAASEFYKLAMELEISSADSIRQAALTAY